MITEQKIGKNEAIAFMVTLISTKVFLTTPSTLAYYGKSAGWLIALLAGLTAFALFGFVHKLTSRFPNQNFPQITETILGPWLGSLFTITYIIGLLFQVGLYIRRFSEMMLTVALPETPISIIVITFLIASAAVAYLGIQTIVRASYLAFPFSLAAILMMSLLTYPLWHFDWLFPLLGPGPLKLAQYGLLRSSDYTEAVVLYSLPMLFVSEQIKSIGRKSIIISMLIFLVVMVTYSMTFPPTVGSEPYSPLYMMARSVYLSRFVQRIEVLFVLFWVVSGYLWIATGFYGSSVLVRQLLKLPDHRPLIIPLAVILLALTFLPATLPDTVLISEYKQGNYAFITYFGIPAFLLLVATLRKKGRKSRGQLQKS